jgi:hypothetical protein
VPIDFSRQIRPDSITGTDKVYLHVYVHKAGHCTANESNGKNIIARTTTDKGNLVSHVDMFMINLKDSSALDTIH